MLSVGTAIRYFPDFCCLFSMPGQMVDLPRRSNLHHTPHARRELLLVRPQPAPRQYTGLFFYMRVAMHPLDQAEKLMHDQRGQSPEEGDVEREQAFQIAQVRP